ncbi:MAG: endonuclease [Bacteroidia bacterium]|nr:MAG: endonuclease [Bacteroidia bacterium]
MLIEKISLKKACILVLMFLFSGLAYSQEGADTLPVRIMFYNTENLFDTADDSLKDDDEFLPGGMMRWNKTRYDKKINSVYKTIIAAGEWNPPAIVGLCEIENRKVLEDLIYGTSLSNLGYGIIHEESPDPRGIDVCMIFRKDLVRVIDYRSWIPRSVKRDEFHSRSVLYAKCEILGDTMHLILNHWPSRRGGVLAGEPLREEIALMVRDAIDSLQAASQGVLKVIILGDFNCSPDDPLIISLLKPADAGDVSLVNLADQRITGIPGTYRYMGTWEMLDQIIVSRGLLISRSGLHADKQNFRIFKPEFLLRNDPKYPGLTTFSTYRGYRYQGGFSDHLPVLLDLGIR